MRLGVRGAAGLGAPNHRRRALTFSATSLATSAPQLAALAALAAPAAFAAFAAPGK